MAELHFRYREEAFSAAEAAAITGLTLTMQRDWRSHGHLPPLRSARATFSPRELAEMRIMVRARARGVSLAESRKLATAAAPDLLHILVSDHAMVGVDGEEARGRRYLDAIDRQTDGEFLNWLSGVESGSGRRIVILYDDGSWKIIPSLDEDSFDVTAETPAILNLDASAKTIAQAVAPRKLFTLMAPPGFE